MEFKHIGIGLIVLMLMITSFYIGHIPITFKDIDNYTSYNTCVNSPPNITIHPFSWSMNESGVIELDSTLSVDIFDLENDLMKVQFYLRYNDTEGEWVEIFNEVGRSGTYIDDDEIEIISANSTQLPSIVFIEWRIDVDDGHNMVSETHDISYWV